MSATARLYAAVLLIGGWLGLLLFGLALRGAVHLVLALAITILPWRALLAVPVAGPLNAADAARAPRASAGGGDRS
jgi:hypothetical protein